MDCLREKSEQHRIFGEIIREVLIETWKYAQDPNKWRFSGDGYYFRARREKARVYSCAMRQQWEGYYWRVTVRERNKWVNSRAGTWPCSKLEEAEAAVGSVDIRQQWTELDSKVKLKIWDAQIKKGKGLWILLVAVNTICLNVSVK